MHGVSNIKFPYRIFGECSVSGWTGLSPSDFIYNDSVISSALSTQVSFIYYRRQMALSTGSVIKQKKPPFFFKTWFTISAAREALRNNVTFPFLRALGVSKVDVSSDSFSSSITKHSMLVQYVVQTNSPVTITKTTQWVELFN
jgi:hypothetical protein